MKLNNKGYLLIEIILASAIAFGLAFFIIDLVLKLKNKNDDLMVETLINTDKTIITNKLMSYAKDNPESFDCRKLTKEGNTIKYNGSIIDKVNEYTKIKELTCTNTGGKITIEVPLEVPQQPDKDYDINLDYKYQIGDMTPPTCSLTLGTNGLITATYQDNDGGSGIAEYGISTSSTPEYNKNNSLPINTQTYYCHVKDKANNSKTEKITVYLAEKSCPAGYTDNGSKCQKITSYNSYWSCGCCNISNCKEVVAWTTSSSKKGCGSACMSRGYDWYSSIYNEGTPNYSYEEYNYSCNDNGTKININGTNYCYK